MLSIREVRRPQPLSRDPEYAVYFNNREHAFTTCCARNGLISVELPAPGDQWVRLRDESITTVRREIARLNRLWRGGGA